MTAEDIRSTAADFAAAARNAIEPGFEGVEVHGANGHLLHQFLARGTNRRTGAYGGSVTNRIRFVVEVAEAVAEAIGPERVGLRVSPGNTVNGIDEGDTAEICPALVTALADSGLAYLHIVHADPENPVHQRKDWPDTLIANPVLPQNRIPDDGGLAQGERLLAAGDDLIALGRPFLANPDLIRRMRTGAPMNQVGGAYLMYVGGPTGYTDCPSLPADA